MVPELAIPEEEPTEVCIHKLAIGACNTCITMTRVQLELNLKITSARSEGAADDHCHKSNSGDG